MISVHVASREEYVRSSFLGLMVSAASLLTAEPRKVTVQSIEVWTWSICVCTCVYTHAGMYMCVELCRYCDGPAEPCCFLNLDTPLSLPHLLSFE